MKTREKNEDKQTEMDVKKINELLRDSSFAVMFTNYKDSDDSANTDSLTADTTIRKSFREEKIAINVAGFYAVECGIGAVSKQTGKTPVAILQQVVDKTLDSNNANLLSRFANATWKAGQPFRGLSRITRSNFIVFGYLSEEEIKKDDDQIVAAATLLLSNLKDATDSTKEQQLIRINGLLKDSAFASEMAMYMEAAYYKGQKEAVPPFLKPSEDTATVTKSKNEENIAIHMAGFYALTCGVEYLSHTHHKSPSVIVQSILNNTIDENDKELLERFANATWKAGQPFRSLDRIERDIFKPFDLLPADEVEKDWVQITKAAKLLQQAFANTK